MKKILLFLLICNSIFFAAPAQVCHESKTAFHAGEWVSYYVFYAVAGVYIHAGSAHFSTSLTRLYNKPVYYLKGEGSSNSSYDWIFKVRDRYESFIDTASLQPYCFIRNISEGSYKKHENVTFNRQLQTAVTSDGVYKVPNCIQDVISMVYAMRSINFALYRDGDTIPFSIFLDNQVYHLHLRYVGKEVLKTRYGKFHTLHFKPLLIKGSVFKGGESMDVWVGDDDNHIPVRIETPIVVGKIKVDMMQYKNLLHPLRSMIEMR